MPDTRNAIVRDEVVSFPDENLILVDEEDREIGYLDKKRCHQGDGILHRAFSLFLFNPQGELLLQQRSGNKPLWPLYWSNSCCSHPRRGESVDIAVERRLKQELGLTARARFVYKFKYQAHYEDIGAEHELCWVYLGRCHGDPEPNVREVADWRFIGAAELNRELDQRPEQFTPWFKLEWQALNRQYASELGGYMTCLHSISTQG